MAKICLIVVLSLLFSFSVEAQTNRKPAAQKPVEIDTTLNVVLSNLAPDTVCSKPEWAENEVHIGTTLKR